MKSYYSQNNDDAKKVILLEGNFSRQLSQLPDGQGTIFKVRQLQTSKYKK